MVAHTKITLKKTSTSGNTPAVDDLVYGELAINYADGKLYYRTSTNTIQAFVDSSGIETIASLGFDSSIQNIQLDVLPFADDTYNLGSTSERFAELWLSAAGLKLGTITLTDSSGVLVAYNTAGDTKLPLDLSSNNTDDLSEGSSNLYYTTARANTDFDTRLGTKSTSDVSEGTNLYYTKVRVDSDINSLIDSDFFQILKIDATTVDGLNASQFVRSDVNDEKAGNLRFADEAVLGFGTDVAGGDLQIFSNDSGSWITEAQGVGLYVEADLLKLRDVDSNLYMQGISGGAVSVYHNGTKKLETAAGGVSVTGELSATTGDFSGNVAIGGNITGATTDQLTEGSTNLYYDSAAVVVAARNAISVTDDANDGGLTYDASTGIINHVGMTAGQIRSNFQAGTGVAFDSANGAISIGQAVETTSDVVFDEVTSRLATATDQLTVGSSILYGESHGGMSINQDVQLGDSNQSVLGFLSEDSDKSAALAVGIKNQISHAFGVTGLSGNSTAVIGLSGTNADFKIKNDVGVSPFNLDGGTDLLTISETGVVHITNATNTTSKTTGGLTLLGGLGVDKDIRAQDIYATNNVVAGTNGTGKFIGDVTGTVSDISNHSTDDLSEGTTNLYFTDARADARIAAASTDDLSEGTTNLYYDSARTGTTARYAISVADTGGDGSLVYNAATGVVTYQGPTATETRAHFSGGTGVTLNSSNGVISIGQAVGPNDSVTFAGMAANGDVVVYGDLTVVGEQITTGSTDLRVSNALIKLADSNVQDNVDIGIVGRYSQDAGSTIKRAGFFRDATNGEWYVFDGLVQDNLDSSSAQTINRADPTFSPGTWNFGALRGQYLGFDSDFTVFSTNYVEKTSSFTAVTAGRYAIDTSGGTFTVTLPANPTTGDYVKLIDVANFSNVPLTVGRNGSTIEGYSDNFSLDVGQNIVEFIYINNTWNVYAAIGQQGPEGPAGQNADSAEFATTNNAIAFSIALG